MSIDTLQQRCAPLSHHTAAVLFSLLVLGILACSWMLAPCAHADTVKSTSRGYVYYTSNGKVAKPGFHVLKGKLYCVGKRGVCKTATQVDGITFTKKGYAKKNTASALKIEVMKCLDRLTSKKMSKRQKLKSVFKWVKPLRYRNSTEPKDIGTPGWVQRCALAVLRNEVRECYGAASVMCAVGYELGYKPVLREKRHEHAVALVGAHVFNTARMTLSPSNSKDWAFVSWSELDPHGKGGNKIKQGLVKEGGSLRCYIDGERVTSAWFASGKTRYYFDRNGVAVTGSRHLKVQNGASKKAWFVFDAKGRLATGKGTHVVKVGGARYLATASGKARPGTYKGRRYQTNGALCNGIWFVGGKFTAYTDSGTKDKSLTRALRAATHVGADASDLVALLGEPRKIKKQASCYLSDTPGQDWTYSYGTFQVEIFHASDGSAFLLEGISKT